MAGVQFMPTRALDEFNSNEPHNCAKSIALQIVARLTKTDAQGPPGK